MNHTITKASACYTGGGVYVYYGQLENGLFFRACDDFEVIYICNENTSTDEANYSEFYEQHTIKELEGETFKTFWNQMLKHIINGEAPFDEWNNYQKSDLIQRII